MKNRNVSIVVIVAVILLGLIFAKDYFVKTVIEAGASNVLGTPVKVDRLSLGVLKPSIRLKGLKIYNPKGFPPGALIDVTGVAVEYDLPAMMKGELHFPLIVFDLNEMVVVKNQDGVLNVDALKVSQKEEKPQEPKKEKEEKPLKMRIDVLTLNVGRVVFKDCSKGGEPTVQAYDVHLKDKTYKNIKSAQEIAALVMVEAMKPTAIQGAKIYGATALLGIGFFPAGIAGTLIGEDSGREEFNVGYPKAFKASVEVVQKTGEVISSDEGSGVIKAKVDGSGVTIRVVKKDTDKTEIIVSARKMMIPKPEIAQGILYQIKERF